MRKFAKYLLGFLLLMTFIQTVKSQDLLSGNELEKFLDRAEEQSQKYSEVFKNLSATEIKTKYYYKTNGELDEKRLIKSFFIVYESPDNKSSQEYRSVLEFNEKNVARDEREVEKFFKNLSKSDSAYKEYKKLLKEGTRFDGRSISWGMTLSQDRPFKRSLRPFFDFEVIGKEKIEGNDVWIIEYKQRDYTPLITANPTDEEQKLRNGGREYSTVISDDFRPTYPLMSGKIRLDAKTGQIWRNEFQITLHPKNLSNSVVSVEIFNEYQSSDFGILVPKKFLVRSFRIKEKDDKSLSVTKDVESIYEYTKFSEFKSQVENYEIKEK